MLCNCKREPSQSKVTFCFVCRYVVVVVVVLDAKSVHERAVFQQNWRDVLSTTYDRLHEDTTVADKTRSEKCKEFLFSRT